MYTRHLRLLVAGAGILLAAALWGCDNQTGSDGGGGASSSDEILIGHVASLTGDTATFGTSADEGIRLALEEVNAAGGVLGKTVRVITEDDRSLPDEAKTVANKLITRDNVVAILGEVASSRSIAIAPVCEDNKVPMLSPGSTNPRVTEGYEYVFRNCFIDPFQGEAIGRFAMEELGAKKVAFLYPVNSDYGVGLRDFIAQTVQSAGAEIVANESYSEKQDVDFKGQLTKIKAADPEVIFVTGYYTEAGLIAKQARELGITVPLVGGDGWDSDQTIKIGGAAIEGCFFANHYSADEDRPEVKKFVEGYMAKYSGKVPDAMAILGYDAMKIMADAINRAGSTDGTKIRDALAATKDFPGASGITTINEKHNADKAIVILEIKGGKFTYRTKIEPKAPSGEASAR
jgi:branched-chain amino acid transport system substrate-binding protein